jgi:hypothetical protein
MLFSSTAHGITAVDLQSGRISLGIDELWDNRTVSSPQLFGELVFGSFGKGPGEDMPAHHLLRFRRLSGGKGTR